MISVAIEISEELSYGIPCFEWYFVIRSFASVLVSNPRRSLEAAQTPQAVSGRATYSRLLDGV
eukprot:5351671-Amphidinium_carterae.1